MGDTLTPELLAQYWARLFPYERMFRWQSYGDTNRVRGVEFACTGQNDKVIRYKFFGTPAALKKFLAEKNPKKIDLGALYKPVNGNTVVLSGADAGPPLERDLVFDLDLDAYDDVRTCCKEDGVCRECWVLVVAAVRVITRSLREDFGFKHILCVYSGRRGVHILVCDERARKLTNKGRSAIVGYLTVPNLAEASAYLANDDARHAPIMWGVFEYIKRMHPHLQHAAKVVIPFAKERLEKAKRGNLFSVAYAFSHFYPRLDTNVSISMNHLLKAPFSVHPGTSKVCVPLDIDTIDKFDPTRAPTVMSLFNQINQNYVPAPTEPGSLSTSYYKACDLAAHVRVFDTFLADLGLGGSTRREPSAAVVQQPTAKAEPVPVASKKPHDGPLVVVPRVASEDAMDLDPDAY